MTGGITMAIGSPKYTCTNRIPSTSACPGVEINVFAPACVAMIDRPMVYHGRSRPPRRYTSAVRTTRPFHKP